MNWWRRFLSWLEAPPAPPPAPSVAPFDAGTVVHLFNHHRALAALAPLAIDPGLGESAQRWAESNAAMDRLDHGNFLGRVGSKYLVETGEDIAEGQVSAEEVVRDWMNSPGHRRQIMNPNFHHVGVGRAVAKSGNIFWCADFSG